MPIYTYRCEDHGDRTFQLGMHDPRPEICPLCGGQLKRVYEPPAVHYVGAGFTTTDKRLDYNPLDDSDD